MTTNMNSDSLFDRTVSVPKCCEELPWKEKCLPCQKCIAAWEIFHSYPADYDMETFNKHFEEQLEHYLMMRRSRDIN